MSHIMGNQLLKIIKIFVLFQCILSFLFQGGYKIVLLDEDYTEIVQLVPSFLDPQIRESYAPGNL